VSQPYITLEQVTPLLIRKLSSSGNVEVFVQIACPRLSIDWVSRACVRTDTVRSSCVNQGGGFDVPVLTPYELQVTLGEVEWKVCLRLFAYFCSEIRQEEYPMDFYAHEGGPWANMFHRVSRAPVIQPSTEQGRLTGV
jgi:2-(3-amino-3-carboxypropyl)histidine synthase